MGQAEANTKTRTQVQTTIKEPPFFKVIYVNDDQTPMEFVIDSLVTYFDYTYETASDITLSIHEAGAAVVAVLPYEIAEQKGIEVTIEARAQNYPLQVKLEAQH